jgi:hypothetical protein
MPSFDNLFAESKDGLIHYNGKNLIRADKFPVKNRDTLIASIEIANSNCRQGFVIDVTGYCEMDGEIFKKGKGVRMIFWQDTMPKEVKLKVFTKQDFVHIYNIWEGTTSYLAYGMERESKGIDYFLNGAAMIVEEIENGRRYYCNDGEPDEDFDDIIFTVRK